jgi:hypothetical protein
MNLFRSEEHVRRWSGFKAGTEEGIVELLALVKVFSANLLTRRLTPDYISNFQKYIGEFISAVGEMGKVRPFWSPQGP